MQMQSIVRPWRLIKVRLFNSPSVNPTISSVVSGLTVLVAVIEQVLLVAAKMGVT